MYRVDNTTYDAVGADRRIPCGMDCTVRATSSLISLKLFVFDPVLFKHLLVPLAVSTVQLMCMLP